MSRNEIFFWTNHCNFLCESPKNKHGLGLCPKNVLAFLDYSKKIGKEFDLVMKIKPKQHVCVHEKWAFVRW